MLFLADLPGPATHRQRELRLWQSLPYLPSTGIATNYTAG